MPSPRTSHTRFISSGSAQTDGQQSETTLSRVLLIAEAANPEWVSVPLIGWSLARAIAAHAPAHLVTQSRNRAALLRAGLIENRDFTAIDSERVARPLYSLAQRWRGGEGVGWTTVAAMSTLSYYHFEWLVWRQFGAAIQQGTFNLIHRITPVSPTTPSLLAKRCARAFRPFIIGPLNGGVPWPKEFDRARRMEREWLSYARGAYKLLPGHVSTLAKSAAIIVGSRSTLGEIPRRFREKCVYIPENAIDPARFSAPVSAASQGILRACFVGRLVPYKGPDMLLEAVAPLIREGRLSLDIIGDGPLMPELSAYAHRHDLGAGLALHGWIVHEKLQSLMSRSQLLLFPSIREFGGGVVLEAMALGLVPVVIDYAGPGELVSDATGFKIPLGTRVEIIARLRSIVTSICNHPAQLRAKSISARSRVRELFTWDVKARQVIEIYEWIRGHRANKPQFFDLRASGATP